MPLTAEERERLAAIRKRWPAYGAEGSLGVGNDIHWCVATIVRLAKPAPLPAEDERRVKAIEDWGSRCLLGSATVENREVLWLCAQLRGGAAHAMFLATSAEADLYKAGMEQGRREAAERAVEVCMDKRATTGAVLKELLAREFNLEPPK